MSAPCRAPLFLSLLLVSCVVLVSCGGVPQNPLGPRTLNRTARADIIQQATASAPAPAGAVTQPSRPGAASGSTGSPPSTSNVQLARPSASGADSGSPSQSTGLADCGDAAATINRPGTTLPLLLPQTACLYAGTTLQFSFAGAGTPTWDVNGIPGGNVSLGTIDSTGLYTAPDVVPSSPTVTVAATSAAASGTATVTIKKGLRLFGITYKGSDTLYTGEHDAFGNPINISSETYVLSEVLPHINKWMLRDYCTDYSYAHCDPHVFEQDGKVYFADITDLSCDFTPVFEPQGKSVSSFYLSYPSYQGKQYAACDLNHVAIVGDSVYWRVPQTYDWWSGAPIGGELRVNSAGNSKLLLDRTDPGNAATLDVADNGTLYAIFHYASTGLLAVYTRDLTTGRPSAAPLRAYDMSSFEASYSGWSFAVDDGIFYLAWKRNSDNAIQLIGTDLTDPSDPLWILQTLPDTVGIDTWYWGADNEHVALVLHPTDSTKPDKVVHFDLSAGTTQYFDLTDKPDIFRMVSVWR